MKLVFRGFRIWSLLACTVLSSRQAFSVPEYIGTDQGVVVAITRMDEVYPNTSSYIDTVMGWLRRVYVNHPNIEIVFLDVDSASVEKLFDTLFYTAPIGSFVIFHGSCSMNDPIHCRLGFETIIRGSSAENSNPLHFNEASFELPLSGLESQEPPDIISFMGLSALISVYYQRAEYNDAGRTSCMALEFTDGVGTEYVENIEALRVQLMNDSDLANELYEMDENIAHDPDNGDLYMERAGLNAGLGNYTEAAEDIQSAIELGPSSDSSYELYSRTILTAISLSRIDKNAGIQIDTGTMGDLEARLDDALAYLNSAIQLDSLDAELYFLRSRVHKFLIDWIPAEEDLSRAIELDPDFTEAYAARGNVNIDMGYTEQAISDLTKAIELSPNSASYYEARAFAYQMSGEPEKAENDLQAASELLDNRN